MSFKGEILSVLEMSHYGGSYLQKGVHAETQILVEIPVLEKQLPSSEVILQRVQLKDEDLIGSQ